MIENPNLYSEKRYRIDIIVFISTINSNEVSGGLSNIFKVLLKHYPIFLLYMYVFTLNHLSIYVYKSILK